MKAVLRVWWTFFTAARLQRVLGVIGAVLLALGVVGSLLSGGPTPFAIGLLAFVASTVALALFCAPVLFRSLSAARMYQLLPHFRLRMLLAVSLVLGAPLAVAFVFVLATALTTGLSLWAIGYALAALVALFLVLFLAFGDARWFLLIPIAVLLLQDRELSPATWDMLAALPLWLWSALALGAWAVFAAWYLRVRQVRGVAVTPQGKSGVDAAQPVPRTVALRVLLAPNAPQGTDRQLSLRNAPFRVAALVVAMYLITHFLRSFPLTSLPWQLMLIPVFVGPSVVPLVRQSRLLWLRIPGARDAVRGQIERALWRTLAIGCGWLVVVAAIAASPLVGHGAAEIALGFALLAGAAVYAIYVALAAVPGIATYFWGFGSLTLLQIGLFVFSLVFPQHSLTAAAVVTAVELAGAALLRALAVRRWRTVDWLRFRPLKSLVGVPRSA
jgi:hypothetical protein